MLGKPSFHADSLLALARQWHKSDHQDYNPQQNSRISEAHRAKKLRYYLGSEYPGVYFTKQEMHYLFYVMKGFSNKNIAVAMDLSVRTLTYYCENVRRRLQCKNRQELVNVLVDTRFAAHLQKLEISEASSLMELMAAWTRKSIEE